MSTRPNRKLRRSIEADERCRQQANIAPTEWARMNGAERKQARYQAAVALQLAQNQNATLARAGRLTDGDQQHVATCRAAYDQAVTA